MHMRKFIRHSAKVLQNRRIFNPDLDFPGCGVLTIIGRLIMDISYHISIANEIKVNDRPLNAELRITHQELAIASATAFLSKLVVAKDMFNIKERKYWFWADQMVKIKAELVAWNESEKKKFRPLLQWMKNHRFDNENLLIPDVAPAGCIKKGD